MACECELQNTLDVEVTQDNTLDVEIGGSAGVLLQAKSVEVTANGTSVVAPDDGFDGLSGVEINTNVPNRVECGDAVFDTSKYDGGEIVEKIKKINVSCIISTSHTKSLYNLFSGLKGLNEIIGYENLDTSMVTDMRGVFFECTSLNKLDLSNWDTSMVNNTQAMFSYCAIEQLDLNNWKTSNFVNVYSMFSFCHNLKKLDISTWDVSKVTDARSLFHECSLLKELDLSSWEVQKVTSFGGIFNRCYSLCTIIGDKTIEDVENGTVALRGTKVNIQTNNSPLRFSSILALVNGLADLTGGTAKKMTISAQSYNNMYNDDDTVPTADVIAERQARIAAICAAKNWNFAH